MGKDVGIDSDVELVDACFQPFVGVRDYIEFPHFGNEQLKILLKLADCAFHKTVVANLRLARAELAKARKTFNSKTV